MKSITKITASALLSTTALVVNAQSIERTAGVLASCSGHIHVMSLIAANENGGESQRAAAGFRRFSENFMLAAERTGTPDLQTARNLGINNAMFLHRNNNMAALEDRITSCIMTAKTGPIAVDGVRQTR